MNIISKYMDGDISGSIDTFEEWEAEYKRKSENIIENSENMIEKNDMEDMKWIEEAIKNEDLTEGKKRLQAFLP